MILNLLLTLLFSTVLLYANNIDTKIDVTNKKIDTFSKSYSSVNEKMALNAKAILKQKRIILTQKKYLKKLKAELKFKEKNYDENIFQLKELKSRQDVLEKKQNLVEEELIFVIAKNVSLSVILEEEYAVDEESLIEYEVLQKMLEMSKKKANLLNERFFFNSKKMDDLASKATNLEVSISNIDNKRKKLLVTQNKNKKSLKKLELSKSNYKKELKKLLNQQNTLKKTLAKLNIIKIDEIKKAQEEARIKKAFDSEKILSVDNLPKVKKHGSSYQRVKTKRYKGSKTIAPFSPYTITKKYGTYTDPIYGIKVFNESISLETSKKDQKVKTVFNGKVIYADKTALLNNMVIMEHSNGLHTIYANLSQIAPNIRKGKKIRKGYTIGRVDKELIFEVTQKSYHINPIRLFQ
ncbi:MAG: peptidoglycan DD-metalloendopeptidase family protein [Campylobacterota bacterium]|nr:peptidoglycan DD-metalloendopeptidase family protein [Campylobacterota bacterium]